MSGEVPPQSMADLLDHLSPEFLDSTNKHLVSLQSTWKRICFLLTRQQITTQSDLIRKMESTWDGQLLVSTILTGAQKIYLASDQDSQMTSHYQIVWQVKNLI